MPRNKKWTTAEKTNAAKAYHAVTLDPVKGAYQTQAAYELKMYNKFVELGPTNPEPGTYKHRKPDAIGNHVRDRIRKPLMKFVKAMKQVTDLDPTGSDEAAIMNMAYAIYKGVTNKMEYKFRTYDARINWDLYGAWMVLKDLPKFQDVPGDADADVLETSSLSDDGEGYYVDNRKRKKSNSNERGGKGVKAAKAMQAQTARRGARSEAMQEHYRRDDERFERVQSHAENMELGLINLKTELNSIAEVMRLKAKLGVLEDEQARAEVKRKLSEL
jgi:hypothetical protein